MKERCEDCKGLEEEIYWKQFQSMQFCQFLTGDFHSQLMIPEKFSEKLGEKLSQKVGLRGPGGTNWDVQLVKTSDVLYLGDGWGNFVDAHSLAEKDILIFKYTGNSQFDVLMFEGSNLCEKESSYFIRKCGHTKKAEDGSKTARRTLKESSSVEIIQEHSPKDFVSTPVKIAGKPKDAFEKQNFHFSDKEISMKKASDYDPEFGWGKDEFSPNPSHVWEPVKLPGSKQIPMRGGRSKTYQSSHFNDMRKASDDEPEIACAEDDFNQNPSVVWEPVKLPGSKETAMGEGNSTAYQNFLLNDKEDDMKKASDDEPEIACAQDEFSQNPSVVWESVKLPGSKQTPMGKCKSTAYQSFHFNDKEDDMKRASDDEPEFAGEYEFSQIPSQVWEPVNLPGSTKEMPMKEGKSAAHHQSYASNRRLVTEAEKVAAMRLASKELSEGSFLAVMRSSHVSKRFYMNLPIEWTMAHIVQERQDVFLRTKKGSWKIGLIFSSAGRGGFSRGWRDFALDNSLEEFDVCVFKLASEKQAPVVLDVSIFRVVPEAEVAPRTRLTLEPSSSSQGGSSLSKRKFSQLENDVHHI